MPKHYRLKPSVVEAEKLTKDNADALAEWCGGSVGWKDDMINPSVSYPTITLAGVHGLTMILEGYYLVKLENGKFDRRTQREFEHMYEPVIRFDKPGDVVDTHEWKSEPEEYQKHFEDPPQRENLFDLPRMPYGSKLEEIDPGVAEAITNFPSGQQLTGEHLWGFPRTPLE